jgi:hypothetical protein
MEQAKTAAEVPTARNRKVVLREYITRAPREDDMLLVDGGAVPLRVPEGTAGSPAVLVKNLYLSCDPYMRGRMRDNHNSYIPPFKPGSVRFSPNLQLAFPSDRLVSLVAGCSRNRVCTDGSFTDQRIC